jgi:hypothetical protein
MLGARVEFATANGRAARGARYTFAPEHDNAGLIASGATFSIYLYAGPNLRDHRRWNAITHSQLRQLSIKSRTEHGIAALRRQLILKVSARLRKAIAGRKGQAHETLAELEDWDCTYVTPNGALPWCMPFTKGRIGSSECASIRAGRD